jgi:hypothetical protein
MKNETKNQHPKMNTAQSTKKRSPKKTIIISSILLAFAAAVVTLIIIIAQHPLAQIAFKLAKNESYDMDITVSGIPFLGSINVERSVDGDIAYTSGSLLTREHYSHVVGDTKYTYNKSSDGTWVVTEENKDESATSELMSKFSELLDPEKYEKVDGKEYTYKQKEDATFENFEDVMIVVTDETVTVTMYFYIEGIGFPTKIVITNIGEVELTLPEV